MGIFDFFRMPDMDQGVEEYRLTAGAILLDVREPYEYQDGHVPGSVNIPLQRIEQVRTVVKDVQTPIFTYCLSGSRSMQAVKMLRSMGYQNVKNIGGIGSYRGEVER